SLSKMKLVDAYKKVDEVLRQAVQGVTDLITKNGFVNLDFNDVKAILTNAGTAIMGMGEGEGEDRAAKAAKNAIDSPLMTFPVTGASGILLNVTTGSEILLNEMADAAKIIEETADPDAQVIWGHVIDDSLGDKVHVTLIATFPENAQARPKIKKEEKEEVQTPVQGQQQVQPVQPGVRTGIVQPHTVQPQTQPQQPRRTSSIYDLYNQRRRTQEGFEEARLTSPSEDNRAFPDSQRRFYDQPAIFRKNRKD
ncbi:MAG: hypothetical protein IJQ56_04600, partial [Synergistaceae bacterium]|nr:hypothetical protein [Synergistaceae bacterium]